MSPFRAGVQTVDVLHLGEQVPEVLGVHALASGALAVRAIGLGQRRLLEDAVHGGIPARLDGAGVGDDTMCRETLGNLVHLEDVPGQRPSSLRAF